MIYHYLTRLQTIVDSRQDIQIERFDSQQISARDGRLAGRLRFYDGSTLDFRETFRAQHRRIEKVVYTYHYQHADGSLIFRYDNAPHYPDLPGFPAHKHERDRVIPAPPPDLGDVLREIDAYLYPFEGET